jgi:hypothetical protein
MDRSLAGPGEPVNTPTWRRQGNPAPPGGGPPPAAGGRAMRTGTGIFLIAAGAVLRFAIAGGSPHGLNVHVVGVVLILAGILGLLLSLLTRGGPLNRRRLTRSRRPGGYDSSGVGQRSGYDSSRAGERSGYDSSRVGERKRAAAADVAAISGDDRILSPDTPGRQDNDL